LCWRSLALTGVQPEVLVSISTIVFGTALLIQGGAMLSEFAQIEATSDTSASTGGGSMSTSLAMGGGSTSTLFLVGRGWHRARRTGATWRPRTDADGSCRDSVRRRVAHRQFSCMAAFDLAFGCTAASDAGANGARNRI
jgi:hypothetical protein